MLGLVCLNVCCFVQEERRQGYGDMDTTDAISEAITMALNLNGWKSTPIAIPFALSPRSALDIAKAHQLSIQTAEQVISDEYKPDKIEGEGLVVYEYFPTY